MGNRNIPQNKIKIVSNPSTKTLTFFLMNEKGNWCLVSNYSELSRNKFTASNIFDAGETIVAVIDRDYNTGGRGVDIRFEGPEDEYIYLRQCVEKHFKDQNIECKHHETQIAVAGKIGSGKTIFIEEMCKGGAGASNSVSHSGYQLYSDSKANTIWYEIDGIDIGKENVLAAQNTFDSLASGGVTDFIYCLSTNKIEELEEELIAHVKNTYPKIHILVLLTDYLDDSNDLFTEQLSQHLGGVKVIPIIARNIKTRNGIVEAFGLDNVRKFLFEGK